MGHGNGDLFQVKSKPRA